MNAGQLADIAKGLFGPTSSVERLAGDASTRQFFRIRLGPDDSVVAMVLGEPVDLETHPQMLVGRHLQALGFPVPSLRGASPENGVLFYEDLGDRLLQDEVLAALAEAPGELVSSEPIRRLYEEAVGLIVDLQSRGEQELDPAHPSARQALDEERFAFEMGFFREHYLEGWLELRLGPRELGQLAGFAAVLAADAASGPRKLCHRDYHSRNLIVQRGRLRLIDYQDARMGPAPYDLASLLRDSYVVLPQDLRSHLFDLYLERARAWVPDPAQFRHRFDVVALQRNLKAIGTFGYQASVRGKSDYLPFIAPTWDYVFDTLSRLPEYADVHPILELARSS